MESDDRKPRRGEGIRVDRSISGQVEVPGDVTDDRTYDGVEDALTTKNNICVIRSVEAPPAVMAAAYLAETFGAMTRALLAGTLTFEMRKMCGEITSAVWAAMKRRTAGDRALLIDAIEAAIGNHRGRVAGFETPERCTEMVLVGLLEKSERLATVLSVYSNVLDEVLTAGLERKRGGDRKRAPRAGYYAKLAELLLTVTGEAVPAATLAAERKRRARARKKIKG